MDNRVSQAYAALPDRLYVIGKDGRIVIAAKRGPNGFKPALKKTWKWLKKYRRSVQDMGSR
ncbi:MAG: hypothetical protein D6814_12940 [Calditrichaeota bacterium]|nr:MAG: hypothetical protein D6814_12940 [Calditrichota bacterium]